MVNEGFNNIPNLRIGELKDYPNPGATIVLQSEDDDVLAQAIANQAKNLQNAKIPHITSLFVNDHLWLLGQKKLADDKPYHRTVTTAY